MESWIQPTTAPKQPDLLGEDQVVDGVLPRVERGWMEAPRPVRDTWVTRRGDSIGITALAVAVVVGFLLLMLVAFPLLLLASRAS
jgi:hypothetical protein